MNYLNNYIACLSGNTVGGTIKMFWSFIFHIFLPIGQQKELYNLQFFALHLFYYYLLLSKVFFFIFYCNHSVILSFINSVLLIATRLVYGTYIQYPAETKEHLVT